MINSNHIIIVFTIILSINASIDEISIEIFSCSSPTTSTIIMYIVDERGDCSMPLQINNNSMNSQLLSHGILDSFVYTSNMQNILMNKQFNQPTFIYIHFQIEGNQPKFSASSYYVRVNDKRKLFMSTDQCSNSHQLQNNGYYKIGPQQLLTINFVGQSLPNECNQQNQSITAIIPYWHQALPR